jgi:hypothetical protein
MWVLRETLRLLERILVAVLIAIVIAEARALITPGDRMHTFRYTLIVVGAVLVGLGAMGGNSSYRRESTEATRRQVRYLAGILPPAASTEPQLAPGAVLFLSGAIVAVLGFVV